VGECFQRVRSAGWLLQRTGGVFKCCRVFSVSRKCKRVLLRVVRCFYREECEGENVYLL
jgi:hypothetical protein